MDQSLKGSQGSPIGRHLRSLLDVRLIIVGFAFLHVLSMQIGVWRWYRQFGGGPINAYPDSSLVIPYLLLFASALLLLGRWWFNVLALIVGGWIIYELGYIGPYALSRAHDLPHFSLEITRRWFAQKYAGQPHEFLQLALAIVIVCYAAITLFRQWRRAGSDS